MNFYDRCKQRVLWELWPLLQYRDAARWARELNTTWFRWCVTDAFSLTCRCAHRNRFGIRCFRTLTYDGYCALHNTVCWDRHEGSRRHPWRT